MAADERAEEMLLALDSGSPVVSVAVGPPGSVAAERSVEIRQSSERLIGLIDECLRDAGATLGGLAGIVALRGPGSFTGLRVGLATALGLHQALGLPAAAVPTPEVLALHGARRSGLGESRAELSVAAVVDALRGEWFAQLFRVPRGRAPEPVGPDEPAILGAREVAALTPDLVCGFGASRLVEDAGWHEAAGSATAEILDAGPLAPDALRLAALRPLAWRPEALVSPLYLRPPAVSLPKRRQGFAPRR